LKILGGETARFPPPGCGPGRSEIYKQNVNFAPPWKNFRGRPWATLVLMMLTPLHLPSIHHNHSCDGYTRHAEENPMRKKSLIDKT